MTIGPFRIWDRDFNYLETHDRERFECTPIGGYAITHPIDDLPEYVTTLLAAPHGYTDHGLNLTVDTDEGREDYKLSEWEIGRSAEGERYVKATYAPTPEWFKASARYEAWLDMVDTAVAGHSGS